jgi:RNA polymerase sigma-70 factor (ECF subfamily)
MEERLAGRSTATTSRDLRFEQLVILWIPEMYRLGAAICGIDDADDVVQESLADAWRGFDRLRDETRVRAWLHSIVVNRARKYLRFRRFRPRTVEINPELMPSAERDPSLSVVERDRLDRAFARLPVDQRACIALHHSIGASVPEIAVALGIPEGTVKSRINAGVVRLRVALREDER